MATVTESAKNAVREFAEPVMTAVEENMRNVRRAVVAKRHQIEDVAAEATLKVRRHPLAAVGIAVGAGVLIGCAIGFMAGRRRAAASTLP